MKKSIILLHISFFVACFTLWINDSSAFARKCPTKTFWHNSRDRIKISQAEDGFKKQMVLCLSSQSLHDCMDRIVPLNTDIVAVYRILLQENSALTTLSISQTPAMALSDAATTGHILSAITIPTVFLLGTITAFLYANMVYTPEIIENAERIRQEIRQEEIQRLLEVVQQHVNEGNDLEELRHPFEVALNMKIDNYVEWASNGGRGFDSAVPTAGDNTNPPYYVTDADTRLASFLKSNMQLLGDSD